MRALCAALLLAFVSSTLMAQDSTKRAPTPGRIKGRVVADSGRAPIEGATVLIPALGLKVTTDTGGRYNIPDLKAGPVQVVVRAIGFRDDSTTVEVRERTVVNLELRLAFEEIAMTRPGQARPTTYVASTYVAPDTTPDRMRDFRDRKAKGVGRFLTRGEIEKWTGRRTAEMLDALGGLKVENTGMQAFATNGRAPIGTCPLCRTILSDTLDPAVVTANARQACYVDVFIDGIAAYQAGMEPPELPYDLNGMLPDKIEGVEFYSGAAQVPPKYTGRFGAGCGVLLIWTTAVSGRPAQPLPAATTVGEAVNRSGKMSEFYDRKDQGIGRFVERSQLAKWEGRHTSNLLETVGGLKIANGGMKAWASNGRVAPTTCEFCRGNVADILDPADFAAGARAACYMDVWVDGSRAFQFGSKPPQPLFDLNSIAPESLEGIEVYSGAGSVPSKYNTTMGQGCGVIVLWTRISPDKAP